jgi:hypothetical protein
LGSPRDRKKRKRTDEVCEGAVVALGRTPADNWRVTPIWAGFSTSRLV